MVLIIISFIRELLGAGTLFAGTSFKLELIPEAYRIGIMNSAPGGFLAFGFLGALVQAGKNHSAQKKNKEAAK